MINISQVSKAYYKDLPDEKKVLFNIDLEIADGSTQFLLGGNGAGKTTLLRIISSLLSKDSGKVMVNGFDTDIDPVGVKKSIGFFSAGTALYERMTGLEFLQYFSMLYDLEPALQSERINEISRVLILEDFLGLRCGQMSSGQRQRMNIARSVLHDPKVYIMDEPTMGLDVEATANILDFIDYQRSRNKTLLIVTHNMEMVHKLGGRVAFLVSGEISHNLSVSQLTEQSGTDNLIDAYRYYANIEKQKNIQNI